MRIDTYRIASPSLEGVLCHSSFEYEGIQRPVEALRAFDRSGSPNGPRESELLERYLHDLYGVFLKRISAFVVEPSPPPSDAVRLQAILQELLKVKRLLDPSASVDG